MCFKGGSLLATLPVLDRVEKPTYLIESILKNCFTSKYIKVFEESAEKFGFWIGIYENEW